MPVNHSLIGKRIKEIREQQGMSQMALAEEADISVSFLQHVESGKKRTSITTLLRIVDALGATVDEILCGNQRYDPCAYQTDMDLLMADCSLEEKRVIYEIVKALKTSLRESQDMD